MVGAFLTRGLALILGYAYPAYECFKTVELNKPEIAQLRFWCQYWILVAMLTVFERVADTFISWLPMYGEAKLAFFVYLWYPKTKGTTYVYETFFRPYVAKHEPEIDRNLIELRTRAGDMVVMYFQKAATYGQTRVFEVLQYVASQSQSQSQPSRPRAPQPQPAVANQSQQPARTQPPASPSKNLPQESTNTKAAPSVQLPAASQAQPPARTGSFPASAAASQRSPARTFSAPSSSETSTAPSAPSEAEVMQIEANPTATSNGDSAKETSIEEAIRVTRGRLRKRAAMGGPSTQ